MSVCIGQSIYNLPRNILDIHPEQVSYHGYHRHEEVTDRDVIYDLQIAVL